MTKLIEVVPYNNLWPSLFAKAEEGIIRNLGSNFIAIDHVGSTSVLGLCAKPKIDIILVVKSNAVAHTPLEKSGYEYRGEVNIPLRHFFRQRQPLNINLHLYEEGNPDIELNILFRDYLRNSASARAEYIALKQDLIQKQESHEKNDYQLIGYNLGKDVFIRKILGKAGYDGLSFRFCSHNFEWESYHLLAKEQIFEPFNKIYNAQHANFNDPEYYHFALYKGVEIVAIAEMHLDNIKYIAVAIQHQNSGYSQHLKGRINQWLRSR